MWRWRRRPPGRRRRCARVQGLEGEDAPEPLVLDERPHARSESAEAAEPDEVGGVAQCRGCRHEVERRIEVGVDVAVELGVEDRREPAAQPPVSAGLLGTAHARDLGGHLVRIGVHVQGGAVGEARVVAGSERGEVERRGGRVEGFPDGRERVGDEIRHRQHAGTVVDVVEMSPVLEHRVRTDATTDRVLAFEDGDALAGAGEVERRGQSREARAHHDDGLDEPPTDLTPCLPARAGSSAPCACALP